MLLLALILSMFTPQQAGQATPQQTDKIRVYVFAAEPSADKAGFVDPRETSATKELQDSVKELSKDLRGKKPMTVVTKREDADVIIEVLDREEQYGGGLV